MVTCLEGHPNPPNCECGALLADGHGDRCYRGQSEISALLGAVLDNHMAFEEALAEVFATADGLTPTLVPDRQRASDPSLLQRLQAATERIKHLLAENRQLREALAHALGQQRTNAVHGDRRDTPTSKSAAIIGPC